MAAGALVINRLGAGTTRGMPNGIALPPAPRTCLTLTATAPVDTRLSPTIGLCCQVRSGSPEPLVGALLRFVLPPEIVIRAADPAALDLPPIEPFGATLIERSVTLHPASGDADLRFEAVLTLATGELYRSNIAIVPISRAARLNGPDSVVTLGPGAREHELRVEAHVVNAGSAPARDLVLELPPPAGTATIGALADTVFRVPQLDPGEARTFAYGAVVTATTLSSIRPSDAILRAADGSHIMLASGPPLTLAAKLPPPSVELMRQGRRLQLAVRGINAGAGRARDITLHLNWPAAFVCARPSLAWNGARIGDAEDVQALARATLRPAGADLRIAAIDAGEAYELIGDLHATGAAKPGILRVEVRVDGEAAVAEAVLEWRPVSDVRVCIPEPLTAVESGTSARLNVELVNAGDGDCTVALELAGTSARIAPDDPSVTADGNMVIAAGAWRDVLVELAVPAGLRDGQSLPLTLTARTDGTDSAYAAFAIRARNDARIDTSAWWTLDGDAAEIRLRNVGTTCARGVALICDDGARYEFTDIAAGAAAVQRIAAGDHARFASGAQLTVAGQSAIRLTHAGKRDRAPVAFDAIVRFPACPTAAGERPVSLHLVCAIAIRTLTLRAQTRGLWAMIDGSLSVAGRSAPDIESDAQFSDALVVLRDIAAGTHIDIGWRVRRLGADDNDRIAIEIDGDGVVRQVFSPPLPDSPCDAIATERPSSDASAARRSAPAEPAPQSTLAPDDATTVTLVVVLDATRLDACIRVLRSTPATDPYAHICSLRALLPTEVNGSDTALAAAVAAAHAALETLLERLAIKLRIPHRRPTLGDCDNATTRRVVSELLSAIALTAGGADPHDDNTLRLESRVSREWAHRQLARIAHAQPGEAASVATAVGLLPTRTSRSVTLSAALSAYVETLHAALRNASAGTDDSAGAFAVARERLITELLTVRFPTPANTATNVAMSAG